MNLVEFWPSDFWTPSSPDLAPLDYGICCEMEKKACATPHKSKEALKAKVNEEWDGMSVDFVKKVCKAFRPRVEAMLEANGGHIDK